MSKYRITIERTDGELINGQNQLIAEGDGAGGGAGGRWTAMLEETDPPMSVAEAIRELALYALTDDPDHLIAAALAVKTRMHKLNKRRAK